MDKIIKQNTILIFISQAIVKIISFFYNIFLARNLGVENFGLYITALTYFSLVSSLSDLGISRYLVREISLDKTRLPKLISTTIFLRLSILSLFFAIFITILYFTDQDYLRRNLIIIAIAAIIPQTISITLDTIFISLLKFIYSGIGSILLALSTSIFGILLISNNYGPYGAIIGLLLGQVLYAVVLFVFVLINKIKWLEVIDETEILNIIKGSLPYGVLGILGFLYFKIDTLMLSYLKGNFETGIYGVSYKFLEAVVFIPSAYATAAFPVLAKLQNDNILEVKKIYFKSMKVLFFLSIIITSLYIIVLPFLINIILPKYTESINAIKILSLTIPFMFLQTPATIVLFSTVKYLRNIILLSLGTLAFNILLNLLLIPEYGYKGAAVVTILSEMLSFAIFYVFLSLKVFKNEPNLR